MQKHLRKSNRQRRRNEDRRRAVKEAMRAFDEAIETGDEEEIQEAYSTAQKALDKAAQHNVLPDNRVSRRKSQMVSKMHEAGVELG